MPRYPSPARFVLRCVNPRCGQIFTHMFQPKCSSCNNLVDVFYDLDGAQVGDGDHYLQRYFDLLPLDRRDHLLLLDGAGTTPCIHARKLGDRIGLRNLYLKDETVHPTGTAKDRATAVTLSYFNELNIREFITVSTGNAASSLAYGVSQFDGFRLHIFCGRRFAERLRLQESDRITVHLVDGDLTAADNAARAFSDQTGVSLEGGFFSLPKREGLKLAYLEAMDQMPQEPRFVVQAVSSAIGIWSAYRAFQQYQAMGRIERVPRLVCVQQTSCAPMYHAYNEGSEAIAPRHIVRDPEGIAAALLRGNPTGTYPYIKLALDDTDGIFEVSGESEIVAATELVWEAEGIPCGYSAGCAVAGVVRLAEAGRIGPDDVVLVNLTGKVGT